MCDVAGRCNLRFGEVFHNFRDPITQRYGSFPFFFVESGFIQNGYFLYVFDLGFWGFGFALAELVCLWALWYNKSFMIKSLHNPFWFNMIQYLNWIPTF